MIVGAAASEPGADELVEEICEHLSALLCDVLCGHLEPDLVRVADDLVSGRREDPDDALEDESFVEDGPPTEEQPLAFPVAAPYSTSEEVGSVMPTRHDM